MVVLARPCKRPWYDVWCAGIVLRASSLLVSRPSAHGEHAGMCEREKRVPDSERQN